MTLPTGSFTTFSAIGNREDLSDMIYRIAPTSTPFMSMCDTVKATNKTHEWQTQALASAAQNAQLEGDDANADVCVQTVRLTNICQISAKISRVTNTQQAIQHAGRDDELAYQTMLKGLELRRDMESIMTGGGSVSGQAKTAGNASTAPKLANLLTWIGTNDDFGASPGASPSPIDGSAARTDSGTLRAFTEAQLRNALALTYESGGNPNVIMVGSFNKQVFSTFTGRATPFEETAKKKIVAAVDAYVSDFGTLKVVPNVFQRARDCWILQDDMWKIAYLRKFVSWPLAITGDSTRTMVVSEYTLEACNEKSSGGVFDLTVS